MKRSRYSEEQIIGILAEHEAGAECADLCRKHGMSEGTLYAWKAKFGGMMVSDARRLKAPRGCRLLHLRRKTYQPNGLWLRMDDSSVAGQTR